MEKYYDLIVSLIKANRKYPGCEALLDEIVKDVYAHAEVVLSTVTNENVVTTYLNKIITTSMITVPRRLGINVQKQRSDSSSHSLSASSEPLFQNNAVAENTTVVNEILINPEPEPVDAEPDVSETDVADEELLQEEDVLDDDSDIIVESDNEEIDDNSLNDSNDEFEVIYPSETEGGDEDEDEGEIDDAVVAAEPSVDKTLVDKMINGVSSTEKCLDEDSEEELLEAEENDEEEEEILEELDSDSDELFSETEIPEEESEIEEIEGFDTLDEAELAVGEMLEDGQSDELSSSPTESESPVAKAYECFSFTPRPSEPASNDISSKVMKIQAKYADVDVLEVFNLKYREKLSVGDISKELGISEQVVLETLNELTYIVKD